MLLNKENMKKNEMFFRILLLAGLLVFTASSSAQDPNFHIYLCFGQSNMEGAAAIEAQDYIVDSRFRVLQSVDCLEMGRTKGEWYTAVPPLVRCSTGLSSADYFGRTMVANLPDSVRVGVINVAVGGCDIRLFDKDLYLDYDSAYGKWFTGIIKRYGGSPYEHSIGLARLAQQDGVIKGILLHQGETNQGDTLWPSYVNKVYTDMLSDLALIADEVPLLAGEMLQADQGGRCASMNPIIATLPEAVPSAFVISSKGCTPKDGAHFNSEGYRELGRRYAEKMLSIQGHEDITYKPGRRLLSANDSLISTEVLPGNKVAFRIYAPEAETVNLRSDDKWDPIEFKKDYRGVWEGVWPNVASGAYRYRFMVDGVAVNDPKDPSTQENVSILKKTSGDDFFSMKDDVPHGAIAQRYYYSETVKKTRRFHVWTPAAYELTKKKLPVLYLIHGGGDVDNAWSGIGCAGNILDNLLAEGKIEPMIVVMPNGNIKLEEPSMLGALPVFKEDLMKGIIPFVESNYKVHTDASNRAIMGLSMGGLETLETAMYHYEDFDYIIPLSSGWWISADWAERRIEKDDAALRATRLAEIADNFNKTVKLLYFTQGGPEDLAYDNGQETMKLFDEAGIKYKYSERPGGHTWMVWRQDLRDLAPLLFK